MRTLTGALAGVVLVTAGLLVPVRADAQPTTAAGLLAHYHDLSREAELVNEELLAERERLTKRKRESARAAKRADTAAAVADDARATAGTARDVDRAAGLLTEPGSLSALMTSGSPEELAGMIEGAGLAAQLTDGDGVRYSEQADAAVAEADRAVAIARRARERADDVEAEVAAAVDEVRRRKSELDNQIAEVRAALDSLSPRQRSLLAASGDDGGDVSIPSGAAGAVLEFATAQLGTPYLWGATGPDAYDCSGLVQTSFRAAGIAMPRVSRDQATVGVRVPRARVRPGDLIYYYRPVHHVAIAVDGDRAIHAPSFGQTVQLAPIDAIGPVTVIRRVL